MSFSKFLYVLLGIYAAYYVIQLFLEMIKSGKNQSSGESSNLYDVSDLVGNTETTNVTGIEKSDELQDFEKKS